MLLNLFHLERFRVVVVVQRHRFMSCSNDVYPLTVVLKFDFTFSLSLSKVKSFSETSFRVVMWFIKSGEFNQFALNIDLGFKIDV